MFKIIALLKRRAELTPQQFRDYFESTHTKLGEQYLRPYCSKYLRRYLQPMAHPMRPDQPGEAEYDCVAEIWFADESLYRAFETAVAAPEIVTIVRADEEKFLDRSRSRRYLVEEHLSWGPLCETQSSFTAPATAPGSHPI